jgi:hypothetical protein
VDDETVDDKIAVMMGCGFSQAEETCGTNRVSMKKDDHPVQCY